LSNSECHEMRSHPPIVHTTPESFSRRRLGRVVSFHPQGTTSCSGRERNIRRRDRPDNRAQRRRRAVYPRRPAHIWLSLFSRLHGSKQRTFLDAPRCGMLHSRPPRQPPRGGARWPEAAPHKKGVASRATPSRNCTGRLRWFTSRNVISRAAFRRSSSHASSVAAKVGS